MCGRYYVEDNEDRAMEMREIIEEINRKHHGTEQPVTMKTGEIFPTNYAPVISAEGPDVMRWGFLMQGSSRPVINARSETAAEKNMFKSALVRRRVVIPTSGFYEWKHEGKKATEKFLFSLPGEDLLYLAGLYTEFNFPDGKEIRFTILTTAANESMRPYHDRMPVYVRRSEIDAWIRDSSATDDIIHRAQPELVATPTGAPPAEQLSAF